MPKRFVCFFIVAIGLLFSLDANAAEWSCYVHGDVLRDGKWYEKTLTLDVDINAKEAALAYTKSQWETTYAPDPKNRRNVDGWCDPITKRGKQLGARSWTCRVYSRWLAVFDVGDKPVLRRGTDLHDEPALTVTPDERSDAVRAAVARQKSSLQSGALKGGRSIVVTLVAGDCWTDTKPPRPIGWPDGIPW